MYLWSINLGLLFVILWGKIYPGSHDASQRKNIWKNLFKDLGLMENLREDLRKQVLLRQDIMRMWRQLFFFIVHRSFVILIWKRRFSMPKTSSEPTWKGQAAGTWSRQQKDKTLDMIKGHFPSTAHGRGILTHSKRHSCPLRTRSLSHLIWGMPYFLVTT